MPPLRYRQRAALQHSPLLLLGPRLHLPLRSLATLPPSMAAAGRVALQFLQTCRAEAERALAEI